MLRLLLLSLILSSLFAYPSLAAEEIKPEDAVSIDISAENWVTSKTAHVTLDAEAAVSPANAGSVRTEMMQAVGNAAKADWRMTNFNRTQDQTGMERWSVTFDARLAESDLNGLPDAVKKASKAGLQIRLDTIDFTPTVEETETARAALRCAPNYIKMPSIN